MTAPELLEALKFRGMSLAVEGGKVKVRGTSEQLTAGLLEMVRSLKPDILAHLAQQDAETVKWDRLLEDTLDGFAALLPRAKTQAHRNILGDIYPTVARKMHQERNELLENLADDAKAVVDRWDEDRPLIGQGECRL